MVVKTKYAFIQTFNGKWCNSVHHDLQVKSGNVSIKSATWFDMSVNKRAYYITLGIVEIV